MNLPSKLYIGTSEYTVLITNRIPRINGHKLYGLCCSAAKKIWVRKDLPEQEILDTFFHEVLHALDFEYGLEGLTHQLIYDMERPLSWFFQDNPDLIGLWLKSEG